MDWTKNFGRKQVGRKLGTQARPYQASSDINLPRWQTHLGHLKHLQIFAHKQDTYDQV